MSPREFALPLKTKQDQSAAASRTHTASVSRTANSQKAAKRAAIRMGEQTAQKIRSLESQEHSRTTSPTQTNSARAGLEIAIDERRKSPARTTHAPINVSAAMDELSTAMRSGAVDAPPLPVAPVHMRQRPMPTLPPAQLASLVRSHVRHVGFTARLKTKLQIRELIEEQKDQKIRTTERAKARPLPPGAIQPMSARQPAVASHQEEKTSHSSPSTHRSPQLSPRRRVQPRGFEDMTSMAARLGIGPLTTNHFPQHQLMVHEAMVQPAAQPEPVVPWPSWQASDVPELVEQEEAPIWRDQAGNSLGIEAEQSSDAEAEIIRQSAHL